MEIRMCDIASAPNIDVDENISYKALLLFTLLCDSNTWKTYQKSPLLLSFTSDKKCHFF